MGFTYSRIKLLVFTVMNFLEPGLVFTALSLLLIFEQKIELTPTLKVIKGVSLFEFMGNMQWRVFM